MSRRRNISVRGRKTRSAKMGRPSSVRNKPQFKIAMREVMKIERKIDRKQEEIRALKEKQRGYREKALDFARDFNATKSHRR